jgi:hypothetical protein
MQRIPQPNHFIGGGDGNGKILAKIPDAPITTDYADTTDD